MKRLGPLLALAAFAFAQPLPEDRGAAGSWQAWKRAETSARVLYITAHPDDEDAGTLTWLARGLGADVTLLSLTRGEGGANVITADFFEALALLRQLELERAAAFYGVKLRFSSARDFGYSKNVGETWRNWNKSDLVAEVGRAVQELRPHVIIAKFHGSARDGHGHHTASGEIAKAVYAASQAMPWKVRKLYTGNWNEKDDWTIRVDANQYDAVLGRTYHEIGLEGYRWHRSQGMDRMLSNPQAANFLARAVRHYKREDVANPARETSFFDGLDVAPTPAVRAALAKGKAALRLENPSASIPFVEEALRAEASSTALQELLARAKGEWKPTPIHETPGAAVSVRFTAEAGILASGQDRHAATVVVRSLSGQPLNGTLRIEGVPAEPAEAAFRLARAGEEAIVKFTLRPRGEVLATAVATVDGQSYSTEIRPVTAPGLRTAYVRKPAQHRIRPVDVRVAPGLRIGYVMGSGDEVPEALRQLGVPFELLSPEALATGDLSRFTTLLLGIRTYAAREDVRQHNARLLDFAQKGGVVIVQYNTQEYDGNYGPYPYTMTARAEEISEENSPVRLLDPAHPVWNTPNKITPADFEGWLEQRGSKFWMTWDERYVPLLETNDTGQAPQRGGWLEARTGQGLYIYCAYAWYRQLPAAVPGATRLFANLISRRP
jgi:LmbE family N-acetylglucosaminyl deacetylase